MAIDITSLDGRFAKLVRDAFAKEATISKKPIPVDGRQRDTQLDKQLQQLASEHAAAAAQAAASKHSSIMQSTSPFPPARAPSPNVLSGSKPAKPTQAAPVAGEPVVLVSDYDTDRAHLTEEITELKQEITTLRTAFDEQTKMITALIKAGAFAQKPAPKRRMKSRGPKVFKDKSGNSLQEKRVDIVIADDIFDDILDGDL